MDNGVDATFYRAAADGIAFCPKIIIAHSLLVALEISWGLAHLIRPPILIQVQVLQGHHYPPHLAFPQEVHLFLGPLFRLGRLLAKDRFRHFPQSPTGMRPIHNLHRLWKVEIGDALNPWCSVIDRA